APTLWWARTRFRGGAPFREEVFAAKPRLAGSVNRLLVIGFYPVNLGYAFMMLKAEPAGGLLPAIETLASKLGALLLSLAAMHFANLYLFHRIRRRALVAVLPPPVAPSMKLPA